MPYRKVDLERAAFCDNPDEVQFGLLHDIAELRVKIRQLAEKRRDLLELARLTGKEMDETTDRMHAIESAAVAYDRALYDMKSDPNWDRERYMRS